MVRDGQKEVIVVLSPEKLFQCQICLFFFCLEYRIHAGVISNSTSHHKNFTEQKNMASRVEDEEVGVEEGEEEQYVRLLETAQQNNFAERRHDAPRKSRNAIFMKCLEHNPIKKQGDTWTVINSECDKCVLFSDMVESLPLAVLPRNKTVLEMFL